MRASVQEQKGSAGVHEVAAKFERLGWGPALNPHHDLGTDLYLALRDERLVDLGILVGVQVKAGRAKYFRAAKKDASGNVIGWWYRESARDHFDYWLQHHATHFIVLHDLETDTAYWQVLSSATVKFVGKGAKVLVPVHQVLDSSSAQTFLAAASASTLQSDWQGSSWTGAANLSPTHRYRHALITPRLVAPHPNMSVDSIDASQALALVVLGRSWRHSDRDRAGLSSLKEVDESSPWDWQLAAGLRRFVVSSRLDVLVSAMRHAAEPHQQAASAAVLAAALIEDGKPNRAEECIQRVLDRDRLETVDHAWLELHRARALFETGGHDTAREVAFRLINLRNLVPADVTAAAISAAAANLLFAVAEWDDFNFGEAIATGDATAGWWRQQVTAVGLGHQSDVAFSLWAHQSNNGYASDEAWDHLRAASLMAGFAGDHRAWCGAMGKLARSVLMDPFHSTDPSQVRGAIETLRIAGAHKNIEVAVRWLADDGSTNIVKQAVDECDLLRSTTTTLQADFALLAAGGHLLEPARAREVAHWCMGTFDDPDRVKRTLHANFDLQSKLLSLLAGAAVALEDEHEDEVLRWALSISLERPGLSGRPMAKLLTSISPERWTTELAHTAVARADDAPETLKHALLRAALPHVPSARAQLVPEALDGSRNALWALGKVTALTPDTVRRFMDASIQRIETDLSGADGGTRGQGARDADALALMNLCHPTQARWEPIYSVLAAVDEDADTYDLLNRLAMAVPTLSADVVAQLEPVAERMVALTRTDTHRHLLNPDPGPAARHLRAEIESRLHGRTERMLELLGGVEEDQQSAALLCRQADPWRDGVLASLARHSSPHVRGTAASVLTHRAANHDESALGQLRHIVGDRSLIVARSIAANLEDEVSDAMWEVVEGLRNHASGHVRRPLRHAENARAVGRVRRGSTSA